MGRSLKPVEWLGWAASSVAGIIGGAMMNMAALFANGGMMPVYLGRFYDYEYVLDSRHVVMTVASHLKLLCDYLPIANVIASPGDIVILSGFASFIVCFLALSYVIIKNW